LAERYKYYRKFRKPEHNGFSLAGFPSKYEDEFFYGISHRSQSHSSWNSDYSKICNLYGSSCWTIPKPIQEHFRRY
jgi:hypothetical protein